MRRNFTPDQLLIDRLLVDDATALEELSQRYCYSLYSYCMQKLNSDEDAKRIARNIFISLWEERSTLPVDFSLTVYLYTEVRKAVIQCINVRLNKNKDVPAIEQKIIPEFDIIELQKAKLPISNNPSSLVTKERNEDPWPNYYPILNMKGLKRALQSMLNVW